MNSIAFGLMEGRTNTSGGVNTATTGMFTAANGDRSNVRNLLVVITDGNSNVNAQDTIPVKHITYIVFQTRRSRGERSLNGWQAGAAA